MTKAPATPPAALFRHWVHSREEDRGDIAVYRHHGFAFPPAFGRDGFEIRADGRFVQFDPGPTDGVVQMPGHWETLAPRTIGVSFGAAARPDFAIA